MAHIRLSIALSVGAVVVLLAYSLAGGRGVSAQSAPPAPQTIDNCEASVPPGSNFPFTPSNSPGPLPPLTLNDGQCTAINFTSGTDDQLVPDTTAGAGVFRQYYFGASSLFASLDPSDPLECVATTVGVGAIAYLQQDPPGTPQASSDATVSISKFDNCAQTQLFYGTCSTLEPDFQVGPSFQSAALKADMNCFDFVSQSPFAVSVDLTWAGLGDTRRAHGHHFTSAARQAVASGSVTVDGGINLTPNPSLTAYFNSLRMLWQE